MKKLMFFVLCMCLGITTFAQEASSKEIILVDYFTYTSGIGDSYPTLLRNAIIGGLQATGRVTVIDADMEQSLKLEKDRRSSEEAMGDETARRGEIKKLGASYILKLHVTQMDGVAQKDSQGKVYYDGLINFTITLINVGDGTVKASKPFNYSGLNAKMGDTREAAITATIDYVKLSMKKFVNDNFDLKASIVSIEKSDKKKGAVEVYINCGETMGVEKGHTFIVKVEKQVAGKTIYTEIAKLKVVEVQGEDMTLCRVVKGGDKIQDFFEKNKMFAFYKPGLGIGEGIGTFLK